MADKTSDKAGDTSTSTETGDQSSSSGNGDNGHSGGDSRRDRDFVSNFLDRRFKGNARAAVGQLLRDNREYRDSFRSLRQGGRIELAADNAMLQRDLEDLDRDNRALREQLQGGTLLKGDDLKAYQAYKALNLPPDKVKERLDAADKFERESAQRQRKTEAARAAKKLRWDPETFAEYIEAKGLVVVMKDVDVERRVNGKRKLITRSVPFLRKADDDKAEPTKARLFVEKNHRGWLAALERESDEDADDEQDADDPRDRDEGDEDIADDEGDEDQDGDDSEEEDRRPSGRRRKERGGGVRLPSQTRGARARGNRSADVVGKHISETFVRPSQRRAQNKDE